MELRITVAVCISLVVATFIIARSVVDHEEMARKASVITAQCGCRGGK